LRKEGKRGERERQKKDGREKEREGERERESKEEKGATYSKFEFPTRAMTHPITLQSSIIWSLYMDGDTKCKEGMLCKDFIWTERDDM
jgi:hypothetical protein